MKADDPIGKLLRGLPAPPADPIARERALHRATIALSQPASSGSMIQPDVAGSSNDGFWHSVSGRWAMAASVAALAGLIALPWLTGRSLERATIPDSFSLQTERTLLQQTEALFGAQLSAVIIRGVSAPEIRLTQDDIPSTAGLSQPVLIEFARAGGTTLRVLGYSGRSVCLMLSGRQVCFEPLITGPGEVILNGENFCWMPGKAPQDLDGYRVVARPLCRL
jgi:hypothetical protein